MHRLSRLFLIASTLASPTALTAVAAAKPQPQPNIVFVLIDDLGWTGVGCYGNSPFRRGKGSEYEGGIRVPLIFHWPARIRAGQEIDKPVHVVDLFPTFMEIAGGSVGGHRSRRF